RHGLALPAEVSGVGPVLLGDATAVEREAWAVPESLVTADASTVARTLAGELRETGTILERLVERRLAVRRGGSQVYYALTGLVGRGGSPEERAGAEFTASKQRMSGGPLLRPVIQPAREHAGRGAPH